MTHTDPQVSVIVPVYKVEQFLDRCVESILAQTYANLEIILVDDGSPDDSGRLCDIWAEKDSRIAVIHQKNGGLSNARNAGIGRATGEYLTFVDSDDVICSNMVEHLLSLCNAHDAQIAIGEVAHVFGSDEPDFTPNQDAPRCFDRVEAIGELWYQRSFLPCACAKLYHRDVFTHIRFTEGILFEDVDLMHTLFWQCRKLVYQPNPVYGYMHRDDSITTSRFTLRDCDILPISQKILDFARETCPELLGAARSYAVTAAFRIYLNAPEDKQEFITCRNLAKALLGSYGKAVMADPNIRKKTRYALYLYHYCRPALKLVYKRKNRWK